MFAGDRTRDRGSKRQARRPRFGDAACVVALGLVALSPLASSCGSSDGQGGAGATAAAGGHAAGSGGAPVGGSGGAGGIWWGTGGIEAPCLDIWVHTGILDEPLASGVGGVFWPRHPFWRDERGLHVAWLQSELTDGQFRPVHLLVSSFDPTTGEALEHRVYDPFPPEVLGGLLYASAGAPDGSFAAIVGSSDDSAPDGWADKIVLGHLDVDGSLNEIILPWSIFDWRPLHVGWDGEAFVFDFVGNTSIDVLMLRLAPDGTEVLAPTEVGSILSIEEDRTSIFTDAATGTTWMASSWDEGVWLSGHQRDGTALPGTGADEYVVVDGQGVTPYWPSHDIAITANGPSALLAWGNSAVSTAHLQLVEDGEDVGDTFVLLDTPVGGGPYLSNKRMARLDDGWWLAGLYGDPNDPDMSAAEMGAMSFWFGDTPTGGIELLGRSVVVSWPPCWPECEQQWKNGFDLRFLASLRYQDELWLGFQDGTEHTANPVPYRIVRVGRSCAYPTIFEIYHPS